MIYNVHKVQCMRRKTLLQTKLEHSSIYELIRAYLPVRYIPRAASYGFIYTVSHTV